MSLFKSLYSKYYDLMYEGKDYVREALFFEKLLRRFGKNIKNIGSIGAGTLNHEIHLAKKGFDIIGIDISPDMVFLANEKIKQGLIKNIGIEVGDMRNFSLKEKQDAILSMFNVLSYSKDLNELEEIFASVSENLKPDGLFIFDCWNRDAVRNDPPQSRWVKFKKDSSELYRLTKAMVKSSADSVLLSIELLEIENDILKSRDLEIHEVMSWSIGDIKMLLSKCKMELLHSSEFLDDEKPISDKKWAMCIVARKL
jgi:SAM-dependent methyltransferase